MEKILKSRCMTTFFFIFKFAYTYLDLVTDLYLVYEISTVYPESQAQKGKTAVLILSFFLLVERSYVYNFFKTLQLEKFQEEKKEQKLTFQDKVKIFLMVFFFADYIYIWRFLNKEQYQSNLLKKNQINLLCRHITFTCWGFYIVLLRSMQTGSMPEMVVLSTVLSFGSMIKTMLANYKNRLIFPDIFKSSEEVKFQQLSLETQLYVAYPYSFQTFRHLKLSASEYPDLYTDKYVKFHRSKTRNSIQTEQSVTGYDIRQFKKFVVQKKKKGALFMQMLYALVFLLFFVLSQVIPMIISTLQHFTGLQILIFFGGSTIFCIPQIYVYILIKLRYLKKVKRYTFKSVFCCIFSFVPKIPSLMMMSLVEYKTPYTTQALPFVKELRDSLSLQFYPSAYQLCIRLYNTYYLLKLNEGIVYQAQKLTQNIDINAYMGDFDKYSYFLKRIHLLSVYSYYVYLFFGILYFLDLFYQKYLEKIVDKTEKTVEQKDSEIGDQKAMALQIKDEIKQEDLSEYDKPALVHTKSNSPCKQQSYPELTSSPLRQNRLLSQNLHTSEIDSPTPMKVTHVANFSKQLLEKASQHSIDYQGISRTCITQHEINEIKTQDNQKFISNNQSFFSKSSSQYQSQIANSKNQEI